MFWRVSMGRQLKHKSLKSYDFRLEIGLRQSGSAGIRTQDPYIKSVLLYQLSYRTVICISKGRYPFLWAQKYDDISQQTTMFLKKTLVLVLLMGFYPGWALNFRGFNTPAASAKKYNILAARADSLFEKANYAAAVPLYKHVVWRGHQAAPRLLLRLAYAEQQAHHGPAALLYLSMAQAREPRLATWHQMAALAARQRLVGYPGTWQQELRIRALRYYYPGLQALLAGAVLAAGWLLARRSGRVAWLNYGAYVLAVAAYLHWLRPGPAGLVVRPGAALMAGPGAGAAWLSTATSGDRLPVLGQQDIWLRVQWQQRLAYVRAADVLVVE